MVVVLLQRVQTEWGTMATKDKNSFFKFCFSFFFDSSKEKWNRMIWRAPVVHSTAGFPHFIQCMTITEENSWWTEQSIQTVNNRFTAFPSEVLGCSASALLCCLSSLCSGSPSPSPWWRRCRSSPCSWALSSWWPASRGCCGQLSARRPSGSAVTSSFRFATACTASWTWSA